MNRALQEDVSCWILRTPKQQTNCLARLVRQHYINLCQPLHKGRAGGLGDILFKGWCTEGSQRSRHLQGRGALYRDATGWLNGDIPEEGSGHLVARANLLI